MASMDKYNLKSNRYKDKICRREFLITSVKAGCGGMLGAALIPFLAACDNQEETDPGCGNGDQGCSDDYVQSGYQALVSSAWIPKRQHEANYNLYQQVAEAATDFSWLSSGDKVLLKLALNSANDFPATTDPWSLGCMIDLLNEKGAGEIIVGDHSGIFQSNSTRRCLTRTGLMDVIESKGATAVCFDEAAAGGHKSVSAANWSRRISITNVVEQVDHIIYLPRIATHMLADKTFSLKIAVGFLDESSRREMHSGNMANLFASINDVEEIKSKFRLSMTSARKVMTTGGPDSGNIVEPDYGLIFASEDLLANDLLAGAFLEVCRGGNEDIYCHTPIQSYIARNGNLEKLLWDTLNENPDSAVTGKMIDLLKKAA